MGDLSEPYYLEIAENSQLRKANCLIKRVTLQSRLINEHSVTNNSCRALQINRVVETITITQCCRSLVNSIVNELSC
jgi:hypothetical protein